MNDKELIKEIFLNIYNGDIGKCQHRFFYVLQICRT